MIDPTVHARAVAIAEESSMLLARAITRAEQLATLARQATEIAKGARTTGFSEGLRHAATMARAKGAHQLAADLERAAEAVARS